MFKRRLLTRPQAKKRLRDLGWTYREAAPHLGVTFEHLSRVLNAERESPPLLQRIEKLGPRPDVSTDSPDGKKTKSNGKTQEERKSP